MALNCLSLQAQSNDKMYSSQTNCDYLSPVICIILMKNWMRNFVPVLVHSATCLSFCCLLLPFFFSFFFLFE